MRNRVVHADEEAAKVLMYNVKKYEKNEDVMARAKKIVDENKAKYDNVEHYKKMFSLIDYTTLDVADTVKKVESMVEFVNTFSTKHPGLPCVAAICVYPNFASVVRAKLTVPGVSIACVSGAFPASQTYLDVKLLETRHALEGGADEIDIVLPVGKFFEGKHQEVFDEITELKKLCGEKHLKVILEVDSLKDCNAIYNASMLAMDAGADFIKTSTGKVDRDAASFEGRMLVMCDAIKEYNVKKNTKIAIKPAGGIRTAEQALRTYTLISEALGHEYQSNKLFRIGASGLADALLAKIQI